MTREASNFADFIAKYYEEQSLNQNIQKIVEIDKAFEFLSEEEDLYSIADLKVKYI